MNNNKETLSNDNANINDLNYSDEFVELNKDAITINKLYYPLSTKKVIKISNIKKIELINLTRASGKYTFIGFCWKLYWYHLDKKRPLKMRGIIIDEKDSVIKIGITPNNVEKCYEILNAIIKGGTNMTELIELNKKKIE